MERGQQSVTLGDRKAEPGKKGVQHPGERASSAEGDDKNAVPSLRKAALRLIPAKGAVAARAHRPEQVGEGGAGLVYEGGVGGGIVGVLGLLPADGAHNVGIEGAGQLNREVERSGRGGDRVGGIARHAKANHDVGEAGIARDKVGGHSAVWGSTIMDAGIDQDTIAAVTALPEGVNNHVNGLVMANGRHVCQSRVRAAAASVCRSVRVQATQQAKGGGGKAHLVQSSPPAVRPVAELDSELKRAGRHQASPKEG